MEVTMNYITVSHEPKYILRRLIAYIVIGLPMAWAFIKVLSFIINFAHLVGIH